MPPRKTKQAPEPKNHKILDVWNSASTGHQRGDNAYANSSAWQRTRSEKLGRQFRYGDCSVSGSDSWSAASGAKSTNRDDSRNGDGNGNGNYDGRYGEEGGHLPTGGEWAWISATEAQRQEIGSRDIRSYMGISKRQTSPSGAEYTHQERKKARPSVPSKETVDATRNQLPIQPEQHSQPHSQPQPDRALFHRLHIYINGSTMPLISDHKLKHLLVSHGASIAISLSRSSVTHVIVGKPSSPGSGGAGGGLAAGKLQKEIERCGERVRVVTVEWYDFPYS